MSSTPPSTTSLTKCSTSQTWIKRVTHFGFNRVNHWNCLTSQAPKREFCRHPLCRKVEIHFRAEEVLGLCVCVRRKAVIAATRRHKGPKISRAQFEFFVPLCGIKDFRGKGIISVTSGFYTAARLSDQEDATSRQVSSHHRAFKGNNTIG